MDIKQIILDYYFFVDTCSFMHPAAAGFFSRLEYVLKELEDKIIIPDKVIHETQKFLDSSNQEKRVAAQRANSILIAFKQLNMLDIRGEKNDPFADNVFHYVFSKFRTTKNLALLTQDEGLAMDILALRYTRSIHSRKSLLVLRLTSNGNIEEWVDKKSNVKSEETEEGKSKVIPYRLGRIPRQIESRLIKVKKIPEEKDTIFTDNYGSMKIENIIDEGGEGKVYRTDAGMACKLYWQNKLTEARLQKLELMTSREISIHGVCWPLSKAYNSYKEFVGFIMPFADGIPMQKCMFVKPLLKKNFPYWSRENLVQLSITWLEKVIELHKMNILIGDINPLNILIKTDREIYFVDTDSYQIEDFPCPVGMANFTAPEIQGLSYSTFLRSFEHEYFSVATLLFMVLLPGKPPYSHLGGMDPITNIKEGDFSYPLGDKSNKRTPAGPWRFIWSHLPYKTKEAFYSCFVEKKRISPSEWLILMKSYKNALERGYLDPNGESDNIFPTKFKGVTSYAKTNYGAKENSVDEIKHKKYQDNDWFYSCMRCEEKFMLLNNEKANCKCPKCGSEQIIDPFTRKLWDNGDND